MKQTPEPLRPGLTAAVRVKFGHPDPAEFGDVFPRVAAMGWNHGNIAFARQSAGRPHIIKNGIAIIHQILDEPIGDALGGAAVVRE